MQDAEFGVLGERVDAGLVVTDEGGVVVYANSQFVALCGLRGESLTGHRLDALIDLPASSAEGGPVGVSIGNANLDMHVYGIVAGHHEPHRLLLFACSHESMKCRNLAERYGLSPREGDILSHALEGMRVESIAEGCGISAHTVRNHLKSIYRKLGVHSRVELMRRCQDSAGAEDKGGR